MRFDAAAPPQPLQPFKAQAMACSGSRSVPELHHARRGKPSTTGALGWLRCPTTLPSRYTRPLCRKETATWTSSIAGEARLTEALQVAQLVRDGAEVTQGGASSPVRSSQSIFLEPNVGAQGACGRTLRANGASNTSF